jgi:hypothetical protein
VDTGSFREDYLGVAAFRIHFLPWRDISFEVKEASANVDGECGFRGSRSGFQLADSIHPYGDCRKKTVKDAVTILSVDYGINRSEEWLKPQLPRAVR